jgi:hypothetical protein
MDVGYSILHHIRDMVNFATRAAHPYLQAEQRVDPR